MELIDIASEDDLLRFKITARFILAEFSPAIRRQREILCKLVTIKKKYSPLFLVDHAAETCPINGNVELTSKRDTTFYKVSLVKKAIRFKN